MLPRAHGRVTYERLRHRSRTAARSRPPLQSCNQSFAVRSRRVVGATAGQNACVQKTLAKNRSVRSTKAGVKLAPDAPGGLFMANQRSVRRAAVKRTVARRAVRRKVARRAVKRVVARRAVKRAVARRAVKRAVARRVIRRAVARRALKRAFGRQALRKAATRRLAAAEIRRMGLEF